MATRTWKIGEYARGGVITVETTKTSVTIIGKEWDFKAGSTRGSSQKNAKEWCRYTFPVNSDLRYEMRDVLEDLTTHYYSEKIIEWTFTKVKVEKMPWEY